MAKDLRSKELRAHEWYGTREVFPTSIGCAWCREDQHEKCCHEIGWYEKLWVCSCDCNKSWVPKGVVIEKPKDD